MVKVAMDKVWTEDAQSRHGNQLLLRYICLVKSKEYIFFTEISILKFKNRFHLSLKYNFIWTNDTKLVSVLMKLTSICKINQLQLNIMKRWQFQLTIYLKKKVWLLNVGFRFIVSDEQIRGRQKAKSSRLPNKYFTFIFLNL